MKTKLTAEEMEECEMPIRGFITAPKPEELLPTERELALHKHLLDWQETSKLNQQMWD